MPGDIPHLELLYFEGRSRPHDHGVVLPPDRHHIQRLCGGYPQTLALANGETVNPCMVPNLPAVEIAYGPGPVLETF